MQTAAFKPHEIISNIKDDKAPLVTLKLNDQAKTNLTVTCTSAFVLVDHNFSKTIPTTYFVNKLNYNINLNTA